MVLVEGRLLECESEVEIVHVRYSTQRNAPSYQNATKKYKNVSSIYPVYLMILPHIYRT